MGLENLDAFKKMLAQVKEKAQLTPIAFSSAPTDQASTWRAWYTFFKQQKGDFLKDGQLSFADMPNQGKTSLQTLVDMAEAGLITKNTAYPAMVALFSSGRTAFMINGNWEVPTLVDLQKNGKLPFDYGIVAFPKLFDNPDTWGDAHTAGDSKQCQNSANPGKSRRRPEVYRLCRQATGLGGRRPHPGLSAASGKRRITSKCQPNNQYSADAAAHVVLEPVLPIFGVGSPTFGAVANFLIPTINGQLPVDKGITQFTAELEKFAKKQQ